MGGIGKQIKKFCNFNQALKEISTLGNEYFPSVFGLKKD